MRGWSATGRVVGTTPGLEAALLDDVVQRTRRLGRAAQALSDGYPHGRRWKSPMTPLVSITVDSAERSFILELAGDGQVPAIAGLALAS